MTMTNIWLEYMMCLNSTQNRANTRVVSTDFVCDMCSV